MAIKPTCKEVHQLVSERMDRELNMVEKLRLRLHMMICDACNNFNGQMKIIRRAMHEFPLDKE